MGLGGFASSQALRVIASAFVLMTLVNCAPGGQSAQLASTLNRSSSQMDQSNIIAGEVVPETEDIYSQVIQIHQILKYSQPLCTAIVVRQNVLLTAAHCVVLSKDAPSQVQARVRDGQDFVWMNAKQIQVYEGYDADKLEDGKDLALVLLEQDLPASYKPAALGNLPEDTSIVKFHVAGYGRTDEPYVEQPNATPGNTTTATNLQPKPSSKNEILHKTNLQPAQNVPEQQHMQNSEKVLYFTQRESGICNGDSGGALFAKIDSQVQVVGIASFVFNQQNASEPCAGYSAFTNLSSYLRWIDLTIHTMGADAQ